MRRFVQRMIRFEILLPLFSNDGQPIERRKFLETDDELVRCFGATSTDTVVVRGQWLYQSTIYRPVDPRANRSRGPSRELATDA